MRCSDGLGMTGLGLCPTRLRLSLSRSWLGPVEDVPNGRRGNEDPEKRQLVCDLQFPKRRRRPGYLPNEGNEVFRCYVCRLLPARIRGNDAPEPTVDSRTRDAVVFLRPALGNVECFHMPQNEELLLDGQTPTLGSGPELTAEDRHEIFELGDLQAEHKD